MFWSIKKIFIGLLAIVAGVYRHRKCVSVGSQKLRASTYSY